MDPSRDLRGAFKTREVCHYAKLSESDLPEFLRKLDAYDGNAITRLAIRLLMLTFVRTRELRGARWMEIDFGKREWRIPSGRTKSGGEHLVALFDQTIEVLRELQTLTGSRELLFPNEHHPRESMSENTIFRAVPRGIPGARERARLPDDGFNDPE